MKFLSQIISKIVFVLRAALELLLLFFLFLISLFGMRLVRVKNTNKNLPKKTNEDSKPPHNEAD